jgi:poly-gamma-glutamate capsule biosynthesis protein CapA/YwtB (metallophosphatase superfamily)
VPKRFNFRGRARDLTAVVRFAGLDVLNLASENARQRAFAQAALNAGASAVIGAHPHVLQPVRRLAGRRLIAYSLGNFVWSAGSAATTRTAILRLGLSPRGVQSSTLLPAVIEATRPRLLG